MGNAAERRRLTLRVGCGHLRAMTDPRDNIVKFQPRKPEPPKKAKPAKPKKAWGKPGPAPYQANRYGAPEPAIRWNKAPKALILIVLLFAGMALFGTLADWLSSFGR